MDPKGKVAVVSGAASGIGFETAKLLAANGARVVLADLQEEAGRRAAEQINGEGGEARFVKVDVTQRADLQRMLDLALSEFGSADIFHNNAGINERDFYDPSSDAWIQTVDVNLIGVIRATQMEIGLLRERKTGGVIVNTASMGGMVPMPTSPVYSAVKAGVIHFCRSLGFLANEGIRVNAVCPTFTDTPMIAGAGEEGKEMMRREVGGLLRPEQVAEGVLELVRDDSRAGAVMRVTVRKGLDYAFEPRR